MVRCNLLRYRLQAEVPWREDYAGEPAEPTLYPNQDGNLALAVHLERKEMGRRGATLYLIIKERPRLVLEGDLLAVRQRRPRYGRHATEGREV